jgi:CPA1 family monovalent cation:H+ antiporter
VEAAEHSEIVVAGLLLAVATLVTLARVLNVPYPVFLVLGGLGIAAIPGMPEVTLDPELVLLIFLPPLLYAAAFFASLRDLRANVVPIGLLAVGLVLATCVAVALAAHALVDGMSWRAAFALGAIVSPTDPVAATAIASRIGVPRRVVSIVEGEALINDGTALVLYKIVVFSAAFSALEAGERFLVGALGGVAIGLAVGWVVARVRARLDDPPVEITISMLTSYLAYLPAEELGLSGVVAAVTVGLYMGSQTSRVTNATVRMQSAPFWQILVFLLNSFLFVLIGLQLPTVMEELEATAVSTGDALTWGLLVSGVVIVTRIVWAFVFTYARMLLPGFLCHREPPPPARETALVAWMGMRGAVSLAAALALPATLGDGEPFPERSIVLFVVFVVILVTLVLQGLTLTPVARLLRVPDDDGEMEEEDRARLVVTKAAIARLDELAALEWTRDDTVERVRGVLDYRRRRFSARVHDDEDGGPFEHRTSAYVRLQLELIQAQRSAVAELASEGTISSDVMRRVERDLDLEEARLVR